MGRRTAPTTRVERLAEALFDGAGDDPLAVEVVAWATGANRFRTFLEAHRDKVRKKLRSATDANARRDVRAELRVAQLLLLDRHVRLAFEAHGSVAGGPDFTVTYRGERPFNLEVTRLRGSPGDLDLGRPLLTKLRQLPPSAPNAVLLAIGGDDANALEVDNAVRDLRRRADEQDESVLAALRVNSSRAFYDRFLRLGAIVTWCEDAEGDARAAAWVNASARITVPNHALQACVRRLREAVT